MSKAKSKPAPVAPAGSTDTPASAPALPAAGDASTARVPAAQAPRIQETVSDEDLLAEATRQIQEQIVNEPSNAPPGAQTEAPAGAATEADPADNGTPDDDELSDAEEAAQAEATEAPAETETETEAEAAVDDENLDALADLSEAELQAHGKEQGWPASFTKRVAKFTKRLREAQAGGAEAQTLREERDALQARLQEKEASSESAPAAAANGAGSPAEAKLLTAIAQSERVLDTIDTHLESADGRDGQPLVIGERQWSVAELRAEKRRYTKELGDQEFALRVTRHKQEQTRQQLEAEALARHPWLKDKANPNTALVEGALRDFPQLREVPGIRLLLANNAAWNQHQAALKAKNGTPASGSAPKPAPAARPPARPAAAPLLAPRREAGIAAQHKKVLETGSVEDATALLAHIV